MKKTIYIITISSEDSKVLEQIAEDIDNKFISPALRSGISAWDIDATADNSDFKTASPKLKHS